MQDEPTLTPQSPLDLDATGITGIAAVVFETTVAQDARFLEGPAYCLILDGLMARPQIRHAWDAGIFEAMWR